MCMIQDLEGMEKCVVDVQDSEKRTRDDSSSRRALGRVPIIVLGNDLSEVAKDGNDGNGKKVNWTNRSERDDGEGVGERASLANRNDRQRADADQVEAQCPKGDFEPNESRVDGVPGFWRSDDDTSDEHEGELADEIKVEFPEDQ